MWFKVVHQVVRAFCSRRWPKTCCIGFYKSTAGRTLRPSKSAFSADQRWKLLSHKHTLTHTHGLTGRHTVHGLMTLSSPGAVEKGLKSQITHQAAVSCRIREALRDNKPLATAQTYGLYLVPNRGWKRTKESVRKRVWVCERRGCAPEHIIFWCAHNKCLIVEASWGLHPSLIVKSIWRT